MSAFIHSSSASYYSFAFTKIDWHEFAIVHTIEFIWSIQQVEVRNFAEKRIAAMIVEMLSLILKDPVSRNEEAEMKQSDVKRLLRLKEGRPGICSRIAGEEFGIRRPDDDHVPKSKSHFSSGRFVRLIFRDRSGRQASIQEYHYYLSDLRSANTCRSARRTRAHPTS